MANCCIHAFQELKKRRAKDVVRVCEPTYKTEKLVQEGIRVLVSSSGSGVIVLQALAEPRADKRKSVICFIDQGFLIFIKLINQIDGMDSMTLILDHMPF